MLNIIQPLQHPALCFLILPPMRDGRIAERWVGSAERSIAIAEEELKRRFASNGAIFVAPLLEFSIGNEGSAEPVRNNRRRFHGSPLGARNQHTLSKHFRRAQPGLQRLSLHPPCRRKTEVAPRSLAVNAIMDMMSVTDQTEGSQPSAPEAIQPGMSGSTRVASWASDSCQPR